MKFRHKGIALNSCMVAKAKHAMNLPTDHISNDKSLSRDYWEKTVRTVGKRYSVDAEVMEAAISRYKEYNPKK